MHVRPGWLAPQPVWEVNVIRIVLLSSCLLFVGCSLDRYSYRVVTEDQLRPSMEEGGLEPGRSYALRGRFYEIDGVHYVGDADGPIIRFEVDGDEFDPCIDDFGGSGAWAVTCSPDCYHSEVESRTFMIDV